MGSQVHSRERVIISGLLTRSLLHRSYGGDAREGRKESERVKLVSNTESTSLVITGRREGGRQEERAS